jgi:hypothetical protein
VPIPGLIIILNVAIITLALAGPGVPETKVQKREPAPDPSTLPAGTSVQQAPTAGDALRRLPVELQPRGNLTSAIA